VAQGLRSVQFLWGGTWAVGPLPTEGCILLADMFCKGALAPPECASTYLYFPEVAFDYA